MGIMRMTVTFGDTWVTYLEVNPVRGNVGSEEGHGSLGVVGELQRESRT